MIRYRNSKICNGRVAPGKRTRGRGKRGISTTSSCGVALGLGFELGCFSEEEEAEHRKVVVAAWWDFRGWWRKEKEGENGEVGLGFKEGFGVKVEERN